MLRLGLTGGIGSGKSTVAQMLFARGAAVIDADLISRTVTASGGSALPQIKAHFGSQLLDSDGALNRDAMRELSFKDPVAREALQAIVHPLVGQEIARQEAHAMATAQAFVVYDIPLLAESSHWRRRVERVVVVDCPKEVQILRVTARNGLAPDVIEAILAAQASRALRIAQADAIIYNATSDLNHLMRAVNDLADHFGL